MSSPLISIIVALMLGYGLEGGAFLLLERDVPVVSKLAGFLQLPFAIFALGVPPPSVDPHAKGHFMALMFAVQGFLFSGLAYRFLRVISRSIS